MLMISCLLSLLWNAKGSLFFQACGARGDPEFRNPVMSTAPRNSVISRRFFRRVAELRTREIQCSAGPNGVSQKVSFYGARATPWVGEIRKVSPTQNGGIRQRDQARQSRPLPAQRRDAVGDASRIDRLSWKRHHRQPRRQGASPRNSSLAGFRRRRVSAVFL